MAALSSKLTVNALYGSDSLVRKYRLLKEHTHFPVEPLWRAQRDEGYRKQGTKRKTKTNRAQIQGLRDTEGFYGSGQMNC